MINEIDRIIKTGLVEVYREGREVFLDKVYQPDRRVVARAIKGAVAKDGYFSAEFRLGKQEKEARWVYVKGRADRSHVSGVMIDIDDSKKRLKNMRSSERKFRSIFDLVLEGITIVDDELRIVDINKSGVMFFGKKKLQILKKPIVNFFGPENIPTFLKSWEKFLVKGKFTGELEVRDKEGRLKVIKYDIFSHGQKDRNIILWQDITEKRIEEKRNEHLLSIAGHELRAPLASAKVLVATINQYLVFNKGKVGKYLQKIEDKLNVLADLIGELLDTTRFKEGKLEYVNEEFDFDKFVDETLREFRDVVKSHRINRYGRSGTVVVADRKRIEEVLTNLLRNAVKYSPGSNKIVVRTWKGPDEVGLSVQDFGLGMPEDEQKKVFDIYFRGKDERKLGIQGLGVGLYISAQIVKHHKGKIWVESVPEEGSTFYFTLPINYKGPSRSRRKLKV
jgi:PAS domain S-box-containing protein